MVMMSGVTAAWSACESIGIEPDRSCTSLGAGSTVGEETFAPLLQGGFGRDAAWKQPAMAR
jgi:hypothetical protein